MVRNLHNVYNPNSFREYSTKVVFRLKNKAAKDHANDGSGKHPHVVTQTCTLQDCETKKCPKPCGQPDKIIIDGHNTHKPPVGRMARFISEEDTKGDPKSQYFVPSNSKNEMTEQERQQYGKDIKDDPSGKTFVDKYKDKYE